MKTLSLVFCLLVLNSCASTPQSSYIRSNGLDSLPSTVELTETPFYPQTQHQCGPAALATVLQYKGVEASPEKLSSQVYIPGRKGSLQVEMTAAARRHGMFPYQLEPSLTDLLTEIEAGNPVLVLQNLGFEWYPNWHYAVVVGYDIENQEIILRSGTTRRWVTSFEAFERTRFKDIIGHGAVKLRIEEMLLPMALPISVADSVLTGIRALPASILLYGPPGCGKVCFIGHCISVR